MKFGSQVHIVSINNYVNTQSEDFNALSNNYWFAQATSMAVKI